MRVLHYIEIENFKGFGEKQRIELDHPTVLIGPNNSGKTTVIQAIALWSQAVKTFHDHHHASTAPVLFAVALNRLSIVSMPVQRADSLWHNAITQITEESTRLVKVGLTVGVFWNGEVRPLRARFGYMGEEVIGCEVVPEAGERVDLAFVAHAAGIGVHLLYSMSGLATDEPFHRIAYINALLGQGRTAEVLRNLCLLVHTHDDRRRWVRVTDLMHRLFGVRLGYPIDTSAGLIELTYEQGGIARPLDLAMAGRGFLQMLLILSYLYSREGGVLLIDEPDAHFEILRQRQIYVLLRDIANETGSQVIIVTHSEVVLEEAVDQNLTLLLEGRAEDLASRQDIKNSLKHYGAGHYVKAREAGHVLYVEGNTDVEMLRALAVRLGHPAALVWSERANVYFVQDNFPEATADSALERVERGFGVTPEKHFFGIRSMVPALRGLAILDNDGKDRADSIAGALRTVYWRRYEAENYFITPWLLLAYVDRQTQDKSDQGDLFAPGARPRAQQILDDLTLQRVFRGREPDFAVYQQATGDVARLLWATSSGRIKLSDFAEEFFRRLADVTHTPMLLRKGELHRLVPHVEPATIDPEVSEKLDLLLALWSI